VQTTEVANAPVRSSEAPARALAEILPREGDEVTGDCQARPRPPDPSEANFLPEAIEDRGKRIGEILPGVRETISIMPSDERTSTRISRPAK